MVKVESRATRDCHLPVRKDPPLHDQVAQMRPPHAGAAQLPQQGGIPPEEVEIRILLRPYATLGVEDAERILASVNCRANRSFPIRA